MQQGVILVVLLVLVDPLHGVPALAEPLFPTQENFDLSKFMGKWHDIAVASTCPWMQRHRGDAAIGILELQAGDTEGKVSMKRSMKKHGTCKQISGDYELTDTPGRFTYHVAKWGADVDAYVVHTNYDEYAIVMMSKQKTGGEKTKSAKLYSRTMELRTTILDDFRRLVREQGMADDTVIIKQNKGECIPGAEPVAAESQSEITAPVLPVFNDSSFNVERAKRNIVLPDPAPVEGSGMGDDTMVFRSAESCKAEPDAGPCFGMVERYFYNSTSMGCQLFTYGGCMGNQNNFVTERECLQSCRTEAACRMPMDAQPCTGQPKIWAFDPSSGLCLEYKKDYCQGNSNKFYSKGECEEYCGVMKDGETEFLKAN
ncbi:protein AMBP-like isoform X1 [Salvelinus fontinalis]|uniref:protein AMBP-like isoform X1 n=1 Tax=Salvelinus fontinalis TaxID=8038 RepID=UPI002485DDB1|nr:protein AMBP-like isoform X1 [Salvelinus fontinalis]